MSSTGSSNDPFKWFEAIYAKPKKLPLSSPSTADGWETVDFPDRLAVAAIPPDVAPVATDSVVVISDSPIAPNLELAVAPSCDQPAVVPLPASVTQVGAVPPDLAPIAPAPSLGEDVALRPTPPAIAPNLDVAPDQAAGSGGLTLPHVELLQENEQLRHQLAELEGALTRSQTVLRAETERWQAKTLAQSAQDTQRFQRQSAQVVQQSQTLVDIQAQIAEQAQELCALRQQNARQTQELLETNSCLVQLGAELDHSTQIAQRQQILGETLTDQLTASHEQVAQLERECASQQQRYAEQLQLTLQADSACKDLRSRLNRQQRYTLQFKAALEKCLEVPAAQGFAHLALSQHPDVEAAEATAIAPVFIPKAQPVRPWSAQPEFLTALQAPIADSPNWSETAAEAVLESTHLAEPSTLVSLTDRIAPRITPGRVISAIELPQMLTAEATASELAAELSLPDAAASLDSAAPALVENLAAIDIWADDQSPIADRRTNSELTAAAIDQVLILLEAEAAANAAAGPENVIRETDALLEPAANAALADETSPAAAGESNWINRFRRATATAAPDAAVAAEPALTLAPRSPLSLVASPMLEKSIHSAQRLSPFIMVVDPPQVAEVREPEPALETAPLFYSSGPSPIIYPLRSAKKLPSLAAVQLPSFPRSRR